MTFSETHKRAILFRCFRMRSGGFSAAWEALAKKNALPPPPPARGEKTVKAIHALSFSSSCLAQAFEDAQRFHPL